MLRKFRMLIAVFAAIFTIFFTSTTGFTQVVLNEIQYRVTDRVEIKNRGGSTVDISSWWLCSRFSYAQISTLTVDFGSTNLAPGAHVVLSGFALNDTSADLGLYNEINNFGDFENAAFMEDFVQWGDSGLGRENVAATKGIWTAGDLVPTVADNHSIEYDGSGNASSDWFDQATPTFGDDNTLPVSLSRFTAQRTAKGVSITWRTESEINNLGFNLYRVEEDKVVKVNPILIRGHGTTAAPHEYKFIDLDAPAGNVMYFIEDIDFSGNREPSKIIGVKSPPRKRLLTWAEIKASRLR